MQFFIYLMLQSKRGLTIYVRESEGRARETRCVYGGLGEALVGRIVEAMVGSIDDDRARCAMAGIPTCFDTQERQKTYYIHEAVRVLLAQQKLYSSDIRFCGPLAINTGENRPEV